MAKAIIKKRGSKPRFDYQKNIDTFFSSKEMEQFYINKSKEEGVYSLRLCLHNVLLKNMQSEVNFNEKK